MIYWAGPDSAVASATPDLPLAIRSFKKEKKKTLLNTIQMETIFLHITQSLYYGRFIHYVH
jgi:hypothetical protein